MKNFRKTLTILVYFCCMASTHAQTISWQKAPQWDSVEMLGENLVLVSQAGKQGVIRLSGTQIIPCGNERILGVKDQRFLVLGANNKLVSIWDDTGKQIAFSGNYYVDGAWPYYSGGMLAVRDEKGNWGFLDMNGTLCIPCRFYAAFPFVNGQASVQYKDKFWAHIGTDGKPVVIKGQKLRSKKISFASTFTQIGDRLLSLVCIEDFMYLIDPSGDVIPNSFISSDGRPLYGAGIGPQIVAGSFTVRFNYLREVETIIMNGATYTFTGRSLPLKTQFPIIDGYITYDGRSFAVDNLVTTPQFQKVVTLSSNSLLVQKNGKWGIIQVDRQASCPTISEDESLKQLHIEHATEVTGSFIINDYSSNTEVYVVNTDGVKTILRTSRLEVSHFDTPLHFEEGELKARLGIIMDGIELAPKVFSITPKAYEKAFSVNCPSSATVSDSGKVSFRITVTNTSSKQPTAPFDVRINGGVIKRSVTLDCGESIKIPVSLNANLGDEDRVSKSIDIKISEQYCPTVSFSRSITCIRQLKED